MSVLRARCSLKVQKQIIYSMCRVSTTDKGYVHTGPVPNGSDPILEWIISVHTVPFRLSMSVHTGPVCYGLVLHRSKKSSCFYQLSMHRIHIVAFKMVPKKLNCTASTKKTVPKLDLLFWRSSFQT